jgi:hypothetical protein
MFVLVIATLVGLVDVPPSDAQSAPLRPRDQEQAAVPVDLIGGSLSTASPPDGEAEDADIATSSMDAQSEKPPTPPHTGLHALFAGVVDDFKNLPSLTNMYLLLGGGAAALAVHPFDSSLNAHLRSHYTLANDIFAPAKYYGDTPEQVAISLSTYAWGRVFSQPKVSHLGMDLLQAQIVSEVLVDTLKITARRDRPDNSQGHLNFSFPSGHAAETFAFATVIERHLGWKKAALAYLVAAYVATSRLHDNVHYASDVTFGAAVGAVAAHTVTRHGPNVWTLLPVSIPGGGVAIMAIRRF